MADKKILKKILEGTKQCLLMKFIQLGSTIVSAVALVAIALNFFSLKKQSNFFNECV